MLITTSNGILVNSLHVAFVSIKNCAQENSQPITVGEGNLHRVVLFLSCGSPIVAADRLSLADAEYLRKDIAHHWSEGSALLDVCTSVAMRGASDMKRSAVNDTKPPE